MLVSDSMRAAPPPPSGMEEYYQGTGRANAECEGAGRRSDEAGDGKYPAGGALQIMWYHQGAMLPDGRMNFKRFAPTAHNQQNGTSESAQERNGRSLVPTIPTTSAGAMAGPILPASAASGLKQGLMHPKAQSKSGRLRASSSSLRSSHEGSDI